MLKASSDAFPKEAFQQSVQEFPTKGDAESVAYGAPLTFFLASMADEMPAWSFATLKMRDRELREFWKKETILAGAMNSVCLQRAAFKWKVEGPERTQKAVTALLHRAITGNQFGWIPFVTAISQDLLSTDNGAFIEVIRSDNSPLAPVVGIGHLDSLRCFRTGNPESPVIYEDALDGKRHLLPYYSVISVSELTSPDSSMRGAGFCAVSRVLRYAQLLRDIAVYKHEKVSGRHYRAIHFVGGVSRKEIDDIMTRGQEQADNRGQKRFIMPQIVASLDPEKPISTATIDLASLPDNFDLDQELKWYITGLSMGFGVDYQDLAPLPGGNLGSAAQSEVLHKKSSAKSPAVFMQIIENIFHFYGVIPSNVEFTFEEKDLDDKAKQMAVQKERIEKRAIQIRSGEITPEVARIMAVREGDLTPEEAAKIPPEYGLEQAQIRGDRSFSNQTRQDTMPKRVSQEVKEEFD